jgi:pimeloyl-ACP methyl ester carboxylesterase
VRFYPLQIKTEKPIWAEPSCVPVPIFKGGLTMKWIITAAAGLAGVGALSLGMWKIGVKSQRPRWLPNTTTPEVPFESVSFQSEGSTLHGWLLKPPSDRKLPVVVVMHGWGSNRSRVLRYANPLYEAGFAVFLFDARSHGDSDPIKAPSGFMFRDDVAAAVEAVRKQPGIDPDRIAVLGHSLGGFGTLLAYAQGMQVRAVVTDSAPIRFETMIRSELRKRKLPLFPLDRIIPRIWLYRSKITGREVKEADLPAWMKADHRNGSLPILMIHSLRDGYVPADDLIRLAEDIRVDHLLVEVEGHSYSEQDPAFWERVLPFLNYHLK